ncbi:MAG: hypothetical protein ACOY0T_03400 [Myxococcota bacterium]
MLRSCRRVAFLFGFACLASAAPSWAQPSQATAAEKATAEALFDEALRLMHAGQFAEACPKFEVSQRIEAAVGTLLYLAECYEKVGRTASSWATFREAASLAEAAGQTDRMKVARSRAQRLEPDLAWLTIQVSKDARAVPGLSIRRASAPVQVDLSGVPVPVDPGDVVVEATAPGYAPYTTTVNVPARGRLVVTVPALVAVSQQASTSAEPAPPPAAVALPPASVAVQASAPPPPAEERRSVLPYVFGGVGLVGLGVGTYFGLKAMSDADEARDVCPEGRCKEARGVTLADDARSAAKISNIAFAVGATAVAAGVVLYFALPGKKEQVGFAPMLAPGSAGLSLHGRL